MGSIVNGEGSVMGDNLCKHGLPELPQEMVDFDCKTYYAKFRINVLFYHFDRDYCCCSNLNFLFTSTAQLNLIFYLFLQLLTVLHYLVLVQYLRHPVVREHRQFVNVLKLSQSLTLVHPPNTRH